jgi:hypothetical protein
MQFKLKARVSRSDAPAIKHALDRLAAAGSVDYVLKKTIGN